MAEGICEVCGRFGRIKLGRFCEREYTRYRKYGDPTKRLQGDTPTLDRILAASTRDGDCLICPLAPARNYPALRLTGSRQIVYAHRFVWSHHHGEIPEGMVVRHRCDRPRCVEIDHLELGTQADNQQDMVSRGRSLRGKRHNLVKLTEDDVRAIRADGRTHAAIAADYGVSASNVSMIIRRRTWKHI